jgi:uncharacterized phage protein gp47/JayE
MSDYGITNEGFKRKRLDLLLEELNDEVKSIFGSNFNVSPESPDGQVNGAISESNANLWEIAEESYNAFNPSAVTGVTQDNLYQLNGITRLPATSSSALLTISGTQSTVIPAGSLVSTSDTNVQFSTQSEVTIPVSGSVDVQALAVETGPISALAGTITTIDTPLTGWDSVTNNSDALVGTNEETDVEFRARREQSVARDAQAIIDAIFAEVRSVPGVTQTTVLENDTNTGPDANGLPAHSVHVIAVGGDDQAIGEAIFLKKTLGATPFGSTTVQVEDDQGIPHDISFSRPTQIPIYVEVNLTTFSNYPVDGDDQIKQAIVDYAEGTLISGRGFFLGDDVIHSEIYTPINTIPGHTVDSMFIKTSFPADQTADIPIAVDETSQFVIANITVNS